MIAPASVALADDHPIFLQGLAEAIRVDPSFHIDGEAADGDQAMAMIRERRPDIAVLDIAMPGRSGLEVAAQVREEELDVRVVILTMHRERIIFQRALALWVDGYLLKDSAAVEILACLHTVASGRAYLSPALADARLDSGSVSGRPGAHSLSALSPAETAVLRMVARAHTSAEIAEQLGNSVKTIENHRSRICRKLGLTRPQALLRFALEQQLHLEFLDRAGRSADAR